MTSKGRMPPLFGKNDSGPRRATGVCWIGLPCCQDCAILLSPSKSEKRWLIGQGFEERREPSVAAPLKRLVLPTRTIMKRLRPFAALSFGG